MVPGPLQVHSLVVDLNGAVRAVVGGFWSFLL